MAEACGYEKAWVGPCKSEATTNGRCEQHASAKCASCGDPATHECVYTGQFVCGAPLCADCSYTHGDSRKGLGWGFIGHRHVKKGEVWNG